MAIDKLCSACLLGFECRYDGKANIKNSSPRLLEAYGNGELQLVCPEQMGGLPTPRSAARIRFGDGYDVLDGNARVINEDGEDVTNQYLKGAYAVLKISKDIGIRKAIFKQKSPSCGCGYTQGGIDRRMTIEGDGVTAALLKRNGIIVKTEEDR